MMAYNVLPFYHYRKIYGHVFIDYVKIKIKCTIIRVLLRLFC